MLQRALCGLQVLLFDLGERDPGDKLRHHFAAVANLPEDEQRTVIEIIEGLLLKHEAKRWGRIASS